MKYLWVFVVLLVGCSNVVEDTGNISVYFCPEDGCQVQLLSLINDASEIYCAFYDLDLQDIIQALNYKKAKVFLDAYVPGLHNYKIDKASSLMHNKFCVFDNKTVLTGSFNPTYNGNFKNKNNVVVLHSEKIAKNYLDEFNELWYGVDSGTKYKQVNLSGVLIENYFCPEDWCSSKVVNLLTAAKESIHFMVFSFTHDQIGEVLYNKALEMDVRGVMDKTQKNKWSEFVPRYTSWYGGKGKLHHKVFIIDKKIVITGSFNPSKNGDLRNDENVLVIHSKNIAKQYLNEFEQVSE